MNTQIEYLVLTKDFLLTCSVYANESAIYEINDDKSSLRYYIASKSIPQTTGADIIAIECKDAFYAYLKLDNNAAYFANYKRFKIKTVWPYLLCIPNREFHDMSFAQKHMSSATFYFIFLSADLRTEFFFNLGNFEYLHYYGDCDCRTKSPLVKHYTDFMFCKRGNPTFLTEAFNRKMQRKFNVFSNANLCDKYKLVLFLLRHHARPPRNAEYIPCAIAYSID